MPGAYWADEVAGTSTDMAGASLDDGVSIDIDITGASDDDGAALELTTAEDDGASDDEITRDDDGASEDDGAAEDDGAGASLELTTAELDDGSTGVTGVGVPRLKIQIRPTMTITATMMIIQVLRFIGCLPLFGGDETGKFVFVP